MRTRRLIGPCLAVLVAAVGTAPAGAQQSANRSHIEVPLTRLPTGQFADFLKSRDHARLTDAERARLKELLETDEFKNYVREQPSLKGFLDEKGNLPDPDSPKARELFERLLQNNPHLPGTTGGDKPGPFEFDPETIKKIIDLPQREPESQARSSSPPANERPTGPLSPAGQPAPGNPFDPPRSPERPREASWDERREELRKSFTNFLRESPLANSETVRDIGRKLSRSFSEASEKGNMDWDDWLERMPRLGNWLPGGLPSLPKPEWHSGMPSVSAPSAGSLSTPDSGRFTAAIWLAGAVLAAVLAWKLLTARRLAGATNGQPAWRLGPWPVDPAEVATRQDLIRAFEYLSLLVFGPVARAWNHRDIAFRLGEQPGDASDERRRAADHLAALYERARYAPPADALPDGEAREARRDLCLLAGVACA
jgi:hypothetical protein